MSKSGGWEERGRERGRERRGKEGRERKRWKEGEEEGEGEMEEDGGRGRMRVCMKAELRFVFINLLHQVGYAGEQTSVPGEGDPEWSKAAKHWESWHGGQSGKQQSDWLIGCM